ncbi:MAG TPA: serpin family protein [Polyangiaceae bacterium]|jgi:serpin B
MRGRPLAFVAFLALAACASDPQIVTTGATFPPPPAAPAHHGPTATGALDRKLFGAFASHPGNFVYSPTSLAGALETVRRGARGATAAELDAALGAADSEKLPDFAPAVTTTTALFVDDGARLEPSFFGATKVDFQGHPDRARIHINRWVAEQTHDRVRDLLAAGLVVRDTRMLAVSTIHLKAVWLTAFPHGSTRLDPFRVGAGATKNVETMHGRVTAMVGEHAGARILDLPYLPSRTGAALALTIMLPKNDDLAAVESAYRRSGLAPFADAANRPGRIDVALPRFSVSSSGDVAEALRAIGVRRAFTDQADFTGISRTEPLRLSAVVQQAFVQVDESGTEAAAASTGGTVEITSARIEAPLAFKVDHPFLFVIRDRTSGVVLFAGRVVDPG